MILIFVTSSFLPSRFPVCLDSLGVKSFPVSALCSLKMRQHSCCSRLSFAMAVTNTTVWGAPRFPQGRTWSQVPVLSWCCTSALRLPEDSVHWCEYRCQAQAEACIYLDFQVFVCLGLKDLLLYFSGISFCPQHIFLGTFVTE